MRIISIIFFVLFWLACVNANVIDTIIFVGDLKTKDSYLQRVVSHISKTEYSPISDTVIFKALNRTQLFSTITIVPSQNENGNVSVFVVLKERSNFSLIDAGAGLNDTEFGENSGTWAWIRLGARYNNFLGVNQRLSFVGQLGRDRFIGMNWLIPIGASPYFFDVGALVGRRPSLVWTWELSPYLNTNFSFGRYIGENQSVYLETEPKYRNYNLLENSTGGWKTYENDKFWEIYQSLYYRFSIDDGNYPPLFATSAGIGLSTNKIMAYGDIEHWEISSDLKQNIPISQKARHSLFLRFRPTLTISGERNKYSGLLTGGQDYVRGWSGDILGSKDAVIYNNLLLGTVEYQFHIFTLPPMKIFRWLSWYDDTMSEFAPQIIGALFLDGGYLFKDINSPKHSASVSAASTGVLVRIIQPRMRMGGEIALAWQVFGDERYLNSKREIPSIHIGIISHF